MSAKFTIGSVGYLNARPLTDFIDRETYNVVKDYPASIAASLERGDVNVALVPVAAVLNNSELRVVPGWCIGADGPVDSVLLVAETPPESWTEVLLDGESRTSAMLTRLLLSAGPLAERVQDAPVSEIEPGTGRDRAVGTSAALVIGDAALDLPERLVHRIDLAELWKEWTGLPFVFAVWAGRAGLDGDLVAHLRLVGEAGVGSVSEVWDGDDAVYLGERIRYDLDDRALMGLRRFAALAHRQQLIPSADVTLLKPTIKELPRLEGVGALLDKVLDGGSLTNDEAEGLAINASLADLGAAASLLRASDQLDDAVEWCLGYRLEDVSLLPEAIQAGAVEIHLSGQTPPDLAAVWVQKWPDVRFVAPWTAVPAEVQAWAQTGVWGLGDDPVGLGIDVLRARQRGAGNAAAALEAMALARQAGLAVTGVLRVGQGEDEMDHIQWIRALVVLHQALGLTGIRVEAALCPGEPAGSQANTATDHLRAVTLAKVLAPQVKLIAASGSEGLGMAQTSLNMGCERYGTVFPDGNFSKWPATIKEVVRLISDAGFTPVQERSVRPVNVGVEDGGATVR